MSERNETELDKMLRDLSDILEVRATTGVATMSEAEEVSNILTLLSPYGVDTLEKLKDHGFNDYEFNLCLDILRLLKPQHNNKLH